jgi:hypothetical protein
MMDAQPPAAGAHSPEHGPAISGARSCGRIDRRWHHALRNIDRLPVEIRFDRRVFPLKGPLLIVRAWSLETAYAKVRSSPLTGRNFAMQRFFSLGPKSDIKSKRRFSRRMS